ncbi:MAG: methyltransferase domain-containing protein [Flavobacteriales bacterium]
MAVLQTAERVSDTQVSDNFVFRRSLLAYEFALGKVSGHTLEVGSGEGYGLKILSPACSNYTMLDKYAFDAEKMKGYTNVFFIQTEVPPFKNIADNQFDFVVSFQVIEHIKNDLLFTKEIHRVLKPGGKFLCTTPNRLMSLSRNPWHIREYLPAELNQLLLKSFNKVETLGVFGGPKAMEYYEKNKASVNRIMRFDIFKMQWWLPRWMLQIPYDIMNRRNRNKLLTSNQDLTSHLTTSDFYIQEVNDKSLDLYYISTK